MLCTTHDVRDKYKELDTNIREELELKDLQTFFEVLRLKIIKRQYKKTFKSDQEHFSVIQICQVLIFIMDYQNNYVKTSSGH